MKAMKRLVAAFICFLVLCASLSVVSMPAYAAGKLNRIVITFNKTVIDVDVSPSLAESAINKGYKFDNSSSYSSIGVIPTSITLGGISVESINIRDDYGDKLTYLEGKVKPDGVITLHIKVSDLTWEEKGGVPYQPLNMVTRYFDDKGLNSDDMYYSSYDRNDHNSPFIHHDTYNSSDRDQLAWFDAVTVSMGKDKAEFIITIDLNGPVEANNTQTVSHYAETTAGEDGGTDVRPDIVETKPSKPKENSAKPTNSSSNSSKPGSSSGSKPNSTTGSKPSGSISGNTGGSSDNPVRDAAVLAIGGGLIAAGATGAATGGGTTGPSGESGNRETADDERKKKQYKMYVYKDFGDSIRKGAKPVTVWARIAEISNGEVINRPDLSEKITASGTWMDVRDAGMQNTYRGAEVSIPADCQAEKATLTFTFAGDGGVFRNNVIFRIVGDPEIVFPSITEEKRLIPDGGEQVILIAGAGGTAEKLFVLKDAPAEPKKLLVKAEDGFDVVVRKSDLYPYSYNAVISNNSAPMQKEGGLFAEPKSVYVKITAEFPDGTVLEDGFYFGLWPQGLTVLYSRGKQNEIVSTQWNIPSKLQNGRLEVLSYAANEEMSDKIPFTAFDICYAVMKPDGTPRIATEYSCFRTGELQPTDEVARRILEKYHYDTNTFNGEDACVLAVYPKDSLLETEGEIHVTLPVTASAEGQSEKAEIPLRLLGVQLDTPSKEWQKEFDELCRTILRFFPAPYGSQRLRDVKEIYGDHHRYDHSELRAVRYDVLRAAVAYWYQEGEYYQDLEKLYQVSEVYFKKPIRFIGDTAFSIVIKYYYPNHEGWITPVKDVCVDTVEEAFWEWIQYGENNFLDGGKWKDNAMSQATTAFENYIKITDGSGGGIKTTDTKAVQKLAAFLFLYMTVDCLINYYNEPEEKRDFWESVRKTFLNTSIMAVKKLIGAGFEKAMNSKTVQDFFQSEFMQSTTKFLNENMASETVNMKGTGINYRDGMKFDIKVNREAQLVNSGSLGKLNGRTDLIHFGKDGGTIDAKDLGLQNTMLGMNGQKIDLQVLNLERFDTATYVGVIQSFIDGLFGKGVGMVFESVELDPESKKFGEVQFPVGIDPVVKKTWYVSVNILKLLHDASGGKFCPGFDYLYERMFGWLKLPGPKASEDIGKEILELMDSDIVSKRFQGNLFVS